MGLRVPPTAPESRMTDAKPYQIRGTQQTLLALRVDRPDEPDFFDRLKDDVLRAPSLFKNAPIVIDVAALGDAPPFDLRKFIARVRACDLQPVGVINGSDGWRSPTAAVGLSVLAPGKAHEPAPAAASEAPPPEPAIEPSAAGRTLLVDAAVRGGQQVYAPAGDLVCVAPVSNGADVIAAGHLHIYATLRGRAFAGFDGDRSAMIFCDRLEAELVSIAGCHLVNDELPRHTIGKRVRIKVANDSLVVDAVN